MFTKNHRHSHSVITVEMTNEQILSIMSEAKPATWDVFSKIRNRYDLFELVSMLIILDQIGVYGSYIAKLYYEYCGKNLERFHDTVFELQLSTENILDVKRFLHLI